MFFNLLIAAVAGVLIGVLSGLFGIGGGLLVIPLLRLGFGVDAVVATATSLFTIIFTAFSGVIGHIKSHTAHVKMGLAIGCAGIFFSPLGSYLSFKVDGVVIIVAVCIVMLYTAYGMIKKGFALRAEKPSIEPAPTQDYASKPIREQQASTPASEAELKLTSRDVAKLFCVGAVTGFASGFLGLGGGFIIIPLITWYFGVSMKVATGTSLVALVLLAIPGAISHGIMGHVELLYGLAIAVGSIPGALLGARLQRRVSERGLRFAFGIILIVICMMLLINEFVA